MKNNQVTPENTSIPDNDDLKTELIKKIIRHNICNIELQPNICDI